MKITLFVVLISAIQVFAKDAYSQNTHFSLKTENSTIESLLGVIESQSEFYFLYNGKLVDVTQKISIDVENQVLEKTLNEIFKNTDIAYKIYDRQVVLSPKGSADLSQQGKKVTGKVTDSSGGSLPGVSVVVKGTTTGLVTDNSGNYSISVPENATLVFSFVGMKTQEIVVSGKTIIDITLAEDAIGIDEVSVVAYGIQKKKDIVGSIVNISPKKLVIPSSPDLRESLQGLASGVMVSNGNIRIRGINSINLSAEPLWIIDGFFAGGSGVNFNEVESVEILKDASATALYGSRAAGGVIIVTTKKAKQGKGSLDIYLSSGIQSYDKNTYKTSDSETYFKVMDEAKANYVTARGLALTPFHPNEAFSFNTSYPTLFAGGVAGRVAAEAINTNIRDYAIQQGNYKDFLLAGSKGTQGFKSYFSVNYRHTEGLIKGENNDKLTARVNMEYIPVKNITLTLLADGSYSDNVTSGNAYNLTWLPFMPIYDSNNPTGYWNPAGNPIASTDRNLWDNQTTNIGGSANAIINWDMVFVKGLSLKAQGGYTFGSSNGFNWYSPYLLKSPSIGQMIVAGNESGSLGISSLANAYINYHRTFKDTHSLAAIFGTEGSRTEFNRSTSISASNFNGNFHEIGNVTGSQVSSAYGGMGNEGYMLSYFSRLSYNFKSRYYIEGSFRTDGSSKFSPEYRWGNFSSLGASWILTDENFMKNISFMNLLKIRGSFGQTGNSTISINNVYNDNYTLAIAGNYAFGGLPSTFLTNIGNTAASWETTNNIDLGIDYGFQNNRINGSLAYYQRDIDGLLLQVPLPLSAGIPPSSNSGNSIWQNIGTMRNSGFEFSINANILKKSNFSWDISFNHTFAQNKITSLYPQIDQGGKGIIAGFNNSTITKTGLELATYYLPFYAGIDPQKGIPMIYEIDKTVYTTTGKTVATGNIIPFTSTNGGKNKFIMEGKSSIPSYFGGFNSNMNYRDFDFSLSLVYAGGFYVFNEFERMSSYMGIGWEPIPSDRYENSWRKPGDIANLNNS